MAEKYYPGIEFQELFNLINESSPNPSISQMQDIISLVHKKFPEQSINTEMLKAIYRISILSPFDSEIKKEADEAIALANSTSTEHNLNPVI